MVSEPAASPRFFVLAKGPYWTRYDVDVETLEPVNRGDAALCQRCGGAIGMLQWLPPYRIELVLHGQELGDFLQASGG